MSDIKVGDKVRIKSLDNTADYFGVNRSMRACLERVFRVQHIDHNRVELNWIARDFNWHIDDLELVKTPEQTFEDFAKFVDRLIEQELFELPPETSLSYWYNKTGDNFQCYPELQGIYTTWKYVKSNTSWM